MPLIRARYTEEEAALLTGMPFAPKPLEDLAVLKEMAPELLRAILDRMARKGLVYRDEKKGTLRYGLNDLFFGMRTFGWPGRTDETSRAVAPPGKPLLGARLPRSVGACPGKGLACPADK